MPDRRTVRHMNGEDKLEEASRAFFKEMTDDKMLDVLADQEVRICMLELGI